MYHLAKKFFIGQKYKLINKNTVNQMATSCTIVNAMISITDRVK